MDLIDEQDVAGFEVGDDRCQVPRTIQGRARRATELRTHLGSQDPGERSLAKPGRPREQHVVNGLISPFRRLDQNCQSLLEGLLANEVRHAARPQAGLDRFVFWCGSGYQQALVSHDSPPLPSACSERFKRSSIGRSSGRSRSAPPISSG